MFFYPPRAKITGAAPKVYLTHDPFSCKIRIAAIGFLHHTYELVAENAFEPFVTFHDLHVGSANARHENLDERFVLVGGGGFVVVDGVKDEAVEKKRFHFM